MIAVHLSAAVASLLLGLGILFLRKGTSPHKSLGRVWVAVMLVTAISSFWITRDGQWSWIHALSVWTLISIALAVYFIRRGRVRAHQAFMIGTYLGLLGAGAGALAPGRTLYFFFFA